MDFPGIISTEKEVTEKVRRTLESGKFVEGRAPMLKGKELGM